MIGKQVWALIDCILVGLICAAMVFLIGLLETGPIAEDLFLRAFFAFVAAVCSKPAIDGTMIELASDKPPKFGRFHFGWASGCMYGLVMILAGWPLSPPQVIAWVLGAVFFGVFLSMIYKPTELSQARIELYDTSKSIYDGWHPLWRIAPSVFLACALVLILLQDASQNEQSPYLILGLAAALINNGFPYRFRHRGLLALQFSGTIAILVGYLSL